MTATAKTDPAAPFVTSLRVGKRTIDLARAGGTAITVRVEMPEVWDTVRIVASPSEPVVSVKRAALEALRPSAEPPEEYVIKLRGWEVLDETLSLTDAGAIDGSIFLLTFRWRRPVR
jgi:hypothetical protein